MQMAQKHFIEPKLSAQPYKKGCIPEQRLHTPTRRNKLEITDLRSPRTKPVVLGINLATNLLVARTNFVRAGGKTKTEKEVVL